MSLEVGVVQSLTKGMHGKLAYGADPRTMEEVRTAKKAGIMTLTRVIEAARSNRRGQRSLAYGVRVRAEGYAYRKVGSCTTARPASEAHYHDPCVPPTRFAAKVKRGPAESAGQSPHSRDPWST